jgi:hypothetical protein
LRWRPRRRKDLAVCLLGARSRANCAENCLSQHSPNGGPTEPQIAVVEGLWQAGSVVVSSGCVSGQAGSRSRAECNKTHLCRGLRWNDRVDLAAAESWYRKSLEIHEALGDRPDLSHQSNCSGSGSRHADRSHVALLSTSRITTSVAAYAVNHATMPSAVP